MVWIITVLLTYNVPVSMLTEYNLITFDDDQACHAYIENNKVELIDSMLEKFRTSDGLELKSFEFFCETKYLEEV
tara:strand:+ start:41 stop:265 length:225 start_codon:yes stop_codon:yes gene_type:complete